MSRRSERRIFLAAIAAVGAGNHGALNTEFERPVAWNRLFSLAESNGLCPLLFEAVRLSGADEHLPAHVLEKLEREYHLSALRNARLLDDLERLLGALADNGISVVVLKGAALSEKLWRNIALRPMADIDILLRENELERARSVLENLGYEECSTSRTPEWYRTYHHHLVPHAQKETGTVVELHRAIVTPQSGACMPTEVLWERSIECRIAGKETRVLCTEDMIVHLCLHMACDDPFADKARSLADLVLLLQRMGREIDWGKVVSGAETPRISRALYYPLLLAQERCGSMVSNDVMTELRKKGGQSKATTVLLRHLMPLGIFKDVPGAGLFPAWVVQRWCEALLSERSFLGKLCALALAFAMAGDADEETHVRSTARLGVDILSAPFKFLRRAMRSGRPAESIGATLVGGHYPKDAPSPVIEVRGLVKRYPQARRYREMLLHPLRKKEITALDGISLTVERGEVFGLLGPNGAGKTTFVKTLATLVLPTEGTVCVEGRNVETDGREIRQRVGYVVSEERSFYWRLTGRQNLRFYAALNNTVGKHAEDRIEEIMRLVGLRDALDRRFLEYSAGMRQRLAIARGLFTRPALLLLDEPTRALDPVAARGLRRFIREDLADRGRTVILATHNLREAEELCDRVAVLNRGRIVTCDAPDALRKQFGQATCYRVTARAMPDETRRAFQALRRPYRLLSLKSDPGQTGRVVLRFESENGESEVSAAMAELINGGLTIESFGPEEKSLEDIFAELLE